MNHHISFCVESNDLTEVSRIKETLEILLKEGVFQMKNSSVELSIDDEGLLQQMAFKKKRRKREGETLIVLPITKGNVIASFDERGDIGHIVVETKWIRKFALPEKGAKL